MRKFSIFSKEYLQAQRTIKRYEFTYQLRQTFIETELAWAVLQSVAEPIREKACLTDKEKEEFIDALTNAVRLIESESDKSKFLDKFMPILDTLGIHKKSVIIKAINSKPSPLLKST